MLGWNPAVVWLLANSESWNKSSCQSVKKKGLEVMTQRMEKNSFVIREKIRTRLMSQAWQSIHERWPGHFRGWLLFLPHHSFHYMFLLISLPLSSRLGLAYSWELLGSASWAIWEGADWPREWWQLVMWKMEPMLGISLQPSMWQTQHQARSGVCVEHWRRRCPR